MDRAIMSSILGMRDSERISLSSAAVGVTELAIMALLPTWLASRIVANVGEPNALWLFCIGACLNTPVTSISSPGAHLSMRSLSRITST